MFIYVYVCVCAYVCVCVYMYIYGKIYIWKGERGIQLVIRDDHLPNVQDRNMDTVTYKVVPESH